MGIGPPVRLGLLVWSTYGVWPDWVAITLNGMLQITSYVMLPARLALPERKGTEAVVFLMVQGGLSLRAGLPIGARLWRTGQRGVTGDGCGTRHNARDESQPPIRSDSRPAGLAGVARRVAGAGHAGRLRHAGQ